MKLHITACFLICVSHILLCSAQGTPVQDNLDDIHCKKHFVSLYKIKFTVKVCSNDGRNAQVFPVFLIKKLDGELSYNYYFETNQRQLKVELFSSQIIKQLQKIRGYSSMNFEFVKVHSVRFSLEPFDKVLDKYIQCFSVIPEKWSSNIRPDHSMKLVLLESKKNPHCFSVISKESVSSAVKVEYKIRDQNKLYQFQGRLVIANTTWIRTQAKETKENITIQRRVDDSVTFARNWTEYVKGFGDPKGNYWIGLEKMHLLTKSGKYKICFEMKKFGDITLYYATYNTFIVGLASTQYKLSIGGFNRTESNFGAESSGMIYHNNQRFSTKDKDHDNISDTDCSAAEGGSGGFWFRSCKYVNPNGYFTRTRSSSTSYINWNSLDNWYGLRYFRMVLIPKEIVDSTESTK